jgi:hypothetical protein
MGGNDGSFVQMVFLGDVAKSLDRGTSYYFGGSALGI